MDWKTLKILCLDLSYEVKSKNIRTFAGSAAFFFFLSMVPTMMMLCSLLPFTSITLQELEQTVTTFMPDFTHEIMISMISEAYYRSVSLLSFAAIFTLWSGAKGMMALIDGINVMDDIEDRRNYFVVRLLAAFYTIVLIVIIVVLIGFSLVWGLISNYLERSNARLAALLNFFMNFRFVVIFMILMLLFLLMYRFVPAKKVSLRSQIPGAIIASLGWSILSLAFSIYVNNLGGFTIYGTFASLIVIMVWLYSCMYLLFIGAYINKFIEMKSYKPFLDVVN